MRKRNVIVVALALLLMGCASLALAAAQETAKGKEDEVQLKPADSYKVEFTLNELDNGKKLNSRNYSLLVRAEVLSKFAGMRQLRVGSKVPYSTFTGTGSAPNPIQYQDVGMNIDCRLLPMGNSNVVIDANWGYTSVAVEQGVAHDSHPPVFRHVSSSLEVIVLLDKPTVIAEVDDVASTHRYVFEVKVTKINP